MIRQVPLIAELVNLATAHRRGGTDVHPPEGDELVQAFSALLGENTAAAISADPLAGTRLAELARALRAALLAGPPAAMAEHINAMLRRYGAQPYLTDDVDQPFHLHFHGSAGSKVEALGGEFATALALVIDGYGADRFGMCGAHHCEAVYIDVTRNRSRRYCSAACTARAKTAAYRRRQQG